VIPPRRARLAAGLALACAAAVARAADLGPMLLPEPEANDTGKAECLAQHEQAQIFRQQRRLLDAQTALRRCSRADCPGVIRADCVDWLDQVSRSVPSVVVTARARGLDLTEVRVTVDGKAIVDRLSGSALELDPGAHNFRFEAGPWPTVERTLLISEGVKGRAIDLEFAPPPTVGSAPRAPLSLRLTKLDYIVGAVGAAALVTSASLGAWALWSRHELQRSCGPFCDHDDVEAIRTRLVLADLALGVAVVSAGILWVHVAFPSDGAVAVGLRGTF
jgi:hypothetical protein